MRLAMSAAVFLLVCTVAVAQRFHHGAIAAPGRVSPCKKQFAPAVFQPDLQKVIWPVTGNQEAQKYFSQGMTQYYGFNYEAAKAGKR